MPNAPPNDANTSLISTMLQWHAFARAQKPSTVSDSEAAALLAACRMPGDTKDGLEALGRAMALLDDQVNSKESKEI